MKKHTTTITYADVDLDVSFFYYPATREWFDPIRGIGDPGSDAVIELDEIKHKGDDVGELLAQSCIIAIESELLETNWDDQE